MWAYDCSISNDKKKIYSASIVEIMKYDAQWHVFVYEYALFIEKIYKYEIDANI